MATRSRIALLNEDGSTDSIYCQYDGYPKHNGKILVENYTDVDRIRELLNLGDLSSLGPKIGEKQDFDNPKDGWCLAYGRDRGETDVEAYHTEDEARLHSKGFNSGEEYLYIFKNGEWLVSRHRGLYEPVTDLLT